MSPQHFLCWQDSIPDTEILERMDIPSIITILCKDQTRWVGHVSHRSDSWIPKQLLYSELSHGSRKVHVRDQRNCYKDSLKAFRKDFNTDFAKWETAASDRPAWRNLMVIHKGAIHSENKRPNTAKDKRRKQSLELINKPTCPPLTGGQPVGGLSTPIFVSHATYGFISMD